ncbi:MAG: superoxide dismutase family protein [Idiomarina sp.]|nr:superoxide dismutase family protein [Idiomarina sp.]
MQRKLLLGTTLTLAAALTGCGDSYDASTHHAAPAPTQLVAMLHPTDGNDGKSGYVIFRQEDNGVFLSAHVEGLPSNSTHGFHIHEYGDCSAPDATSAGGHFNPTGAPHGGPDSGERHVGDLGNLTSDNNGMAHLEMTDHKLSMTGAHSILGRGVIVHAQPDDLVSQPVGEAGARILCGVVGIAQGGVNSSH